MNEKQSNRNFPPAGYDVVSWPAGDSPDWPAIAAACKMFPEPAIVEVDTASDDTKAVVIAQAPLTQEQAQALFEEEMRGQ